MHFENKIYKLIDLGFLEVRNIDLPRKVRFRQRVKRVNELLYIKLIKIVQKIELMKIFEKYIQENPDTPIVEMDTVEGKKGG